jgi:hypothetical protein
MVTFASYPIKLCPFRSSVWHTSITLVMLPSICAGEDAEPVQKGGLNREDSATVREHAHAAPEEAPVWAKIPGL